MPVQKTVIFLGDGMADEPVPELGGETPLQHAKTPAMDFSPESSKSWMIRAVCIEILFAISFISSMSLEVKLKFCSLVFILALLELLLSCWPNNSRYSNPGKNRKAMRKKIVTILSNVI